MVRRVDNEKLREGGQYAQDLESFSTGSITDSDDGQAWETLREIGFEGGDFIQLADLFSQNTESTASDSYGTYSPDDLKQRLIYDRKAPTNGELVFGSLVAVSPNGDAVDVRLYNQFDGETIVESLGNTGSGTVVELGPSPYTPTTTDGQMNAVLEFRNSDNSTTVSVNNGVTFYGVEL